MLMIRAIVRPERVDGILEQLMAEGFPAVTKMSVSVNYIEPLLLHSASHA